MIFWGGVTGGTGVSSGARYDPPTDSWTPIAPGGFAYSGQAAVWTGAQMLVIGGSSGGTALNIHYAYTPPRTTYLYMKP